MYSRNMKSHSLLSPKDQKLVIQESPSASLPNKNYSTTSRRQKSFNFDRQSMKSSSPHLTHIGGIMPKSAMNRDSMLSSNKRFSMGASDGFYDSSAPYTTQNAKDVSKSYLDRFK